ncbi:hypothetical protein [Pseudomonas sp. 24 E 13]|nr:hypothetical protein [Pseudomonas sp. 24 E 13]CRM98697.1 hypothetical protein [Pseudomonas sp. 34 E 7]
MVDNAGASWIAGRHGEVQYHLVGVEVAMIGLHLLAQCSAAEAVDVFNALVERAPLVLSQHPCHVLLVPMVGKTVVGAGLREPFGQLVDYLLQQRGGRCLDLGKENRRVRERVQAPLKGFFVLALERQGGEVFQLLIEDQAGLLFEHVAIRFVAFPGELVELELALHPGAPGVTEVID